jgi:hypothetical protein
MNEILVAIEKKQQAEIQDVDFRGYLEKRLVESTHVRT